MAKRVLQIPAEALEKYEEFHRRKPKLVGEFPKSFRIPIVMTRAGRSEWVTYRSDKVDPETLRKPKKPIDYIHEHDAGVTTYVPAERGKSSVFVPETFRDVAAIVRLGTCLGFCVDGREAEAVAPMPDLYCTPDGKCLLVIQSRQTVLAMMWGGALGVFARGIDG